MTIAPLNPVVAVQVQKPMNPTANEEFRSNVVVMGPSIEPKAGASLRDAILAASAVAKEKGGAIGVFEAGRTQTLSYGELFNQRAGGVERLKFEFDGSSPVGGPYTDRFERTSFGAGTTDAAALQAIVGAGSFASFSEGGTEGKVTSLKALEA